MLKDTHPHLILEIHPTKNNGLDVDKLYTHSHKKIWWTCNKGHEWAARIYNRSNGQGCPYCNSNKVCIDNCLALTRPELIKEWHSKNNITPYDVMPSSNKKVWWKCQQGHEWQSTINNRTNLSVKRGCPICGNKTIIFENSLQFKKEYLCKEWDFNKNIIHPSKVSCGSRKKVWWKCIRNHSWLASIYDRSIGCNGCPYCSGIKCCIENSVGQLYPHLITEWHPTKNKELTPYNVTKCSGKKINWICNNQHEWVSTVYHRTNGSNCPRCVSRFKKQGLIFEILKTLVPNHEMKYNFKHDLLRFKSKKPMELDIFFPKLNLAIEYQGEYHFFNIHGESELKSCRERDQAKHKACKENNIKLIEINYNDSINKDYIYSLIKDFI